jgi:tetratricopeptide (TPR) repeat protein
MIPEPRSSEQPGSVRVRANGRIVCTLVVILVSIASLYARETTAPEAAASPKRLVIAILGLENQTNNPGLAHCRYAAELLGNSLGRTEAVRTLSAGAVKYAFRQVGLRPGDAIDPNRARTMGGHIEAQRVIWGHYAKKAGLWQVGVRVMNVATGAISPEFSAEAGDWHDVRDKLNKQILTELGITPSPEEKKKMAERWTRSADALDWCFKVQLSQDQGNPVTDLEALSRKAIAADPNCAMAYANLAATLATQGKFDPAEQAAMKALQLKSDFAQARTILGWMYLTQHQYARAEAEFRQASQLDPGDAQYLVDQARVCLAQRKQDDATAVLEKAVSLDRTNAEAHACLANVYALLQQPGDALRELGEARRYLPEGVHGANALSGIAFAYERLGRRSEAIECHERTLDLARELGTNPDTVRLVEKRVQYLKSTLTPTFIEASPPKRYAEDGLDRILWDKLTDDERALVGNPFSCTDAMREWAKDLTRGANDDLDKANAIFEELSARLIPGGPTRSRTAQEVFAAWKDPKVHLACMDHAVLFVALARAAGVDAFLVSVSRLPDGTARGHACAAVFAADRALLVDSAFRWFGVPHKQYMILDDLQATAALCFVNQGLDNPTELAAYRAGSKLWPDWLAGRLTLIASLIRARQLPEARRLFAEIPPPQSQDYEAAVYWSLAGEPALEQDWDRAKECLLKSIAIWPGQSYAYFGLGRVYVRRHRLADARTAFRTCLRNEPQEWVAGMARGAIVRINEEIGVEAAPDTIQPEPKSR